MGGAGSPRHAAAVEGCCLHAAHAACVYLHACMCACARVARLHACTCCVLKEPKGGQAHVAFWLIATLWGLGFSMRVALQASGKGPCTLSPSTLPPPLLPVCTSSSCTLHAAAGAVRRAQDQVRVAGQAARDPVRSRPSAFSSVLHSSTAAAAGGGAGRAGRQVFLFVFFL